MVVRDCDIYAEQLVELGHGYPLWEPGPSSGHSCVALGDVGYIQRGHFEFLFNASSANQADSKWVSLPAGPEGYKVYEGSSRGPTVMSSRSVKVLESGVGAGMDLAAAGAKFEFEIKSNRDKGAAVATRYRTRVVNAVENKLFKTYIKAHFNAWYTTFASRHEIEDSDLVLVTGYDITDDWAMCAFSSNWQDVDLGVNVSGLGVSLVSGYVRWQCHTLGTILAHNGPDRYEEEDMPLPTSHGSANGGEVALDCRLLETSPRTSNSGSTPSKPTQCIFLRGYRIKTFLKSVVDIPTDKLKAAAGPHELERRKDDEEPSPPFVSVEDNENECSDIEDISGDIKPYNPYTALFDYIRDDSDPPASRALVHDDDVVHVYKLGMRLEDTSGVDDILKRVRPRIVVDDSGVGFIENEETYKEISPTMQGSTERTATEDLAKLLSLVHKGVTITPAPAYKPTPTPPPAYKSAPESLSINDALRYLDIVRNTFSEQPNAYNRFLMIFKDFKDMVIDTGTVMTRMGELFVTSGHPELIDGFNTFLPSGYALQRPTSADTREICLITPHGPITTMLGNNAIQ